MKKATGAEGFFDDGLTYMFKNGDGSLAAVRPRHIHFEIQTKTAEDTETCDFRFYSVEKVEAPAAGRLLEDSKQEVVTQSPSGPNDNYKKIQFSDVAFFRLGYFDFAKLNLENMLQKYEADKWFNIDLLLDFDEQRVSIYIDNNPL